MACSFGDCPPNKKITHLEQQIPTFLTSDNFMNMNSLAHFGTIRAFIIVLIVGLATSAIADIADIVTIEVTIKSVDAKGRTITAPRKGKTLELDVSRKAEVIINSKAGKLDDLAAGQKAKIDFETTLEIV
jgi:hypothetical protein